MYQSYPIAQYGGTTSGQYPGSLPAQDDEWWETALDYLGGLFKGIYPKPLPPPLPFTAAQVAMMMERNPAIRSAIRNHVANQGHGHLFLGHQPTAAELDNVQTLAALAVWFGNGTGDDLSRGEHEIRDLIISGMQSIAPTVPGGDPSYPGPGWTPPPTTGGIGGSTGLLLLAAGAAVWYTRR